MLSVLATALGCQSLDVGRSAELPPIGVQDRETFAWELEHTISDLAAQLQGITQSVDLSELDAPIRSEVRRGLDQIEALLLHLRSAQAEFHAAGSQDWREAAAHANELISEIEEEFERLDALLGPAVLWSGLERIGPPGRYWRPLARSTRETLRPGRPS